MSLKVKILTFTTFFGFVGTSNAFSGTLLDQAVESAYQAYPDLEPQDIKQLSFLVTDWVLHYEKAVTLGTGSHYTDRIEAKIFSDVLTHKDQCSGDINLQNCARSLICDKKIFTNFWDIWNEHNC